MRKVLFLLAAAAMLTGCAQTLTAMVNERAQQQCEDDQSHSGRTLTSRNSTLVSSRWIWKPMRPGAS